MPRLAAFLSACLLLGLPAAQAQGIAFILNSAAASISVIDMTAMKEVRRIPVLREPHHLVLSPDRRSLMVGDTVGNEMLFLDPATGAIQKRVPMSDPYQFGYSPDTRFFVAAALARNQIDVYDGRTLSLLKRFEVRKTPSHLDYAPDSGTVYVSLQDTDSLIAIDLRALAVRWQQPVGKTPAGVIWHDGHVLVANMGTDYVSKIRPADGAEVARIVTGKGAHTVFRSPLTKVLWVNNRAGGTTVALDPATLKVTQTFKVSGGPDDIDFAPDGRLWITRRWAEKVAVLNPTTGVIEDVKVGRSPHGLWVNAAAPAPTAVASR
jgi:DNA-binding beta-propeller fold protein YncE